MLSTQRSWGVMRYQSSTSGSTHRSIAGERGGQALGEDGFSIGYLLTGTDMKILRTRADENGVDLVYRGLARRGGSLPVGRR